MSLLLDTQVLMFGLDRLRDDVLAPNDFRELPVTMRHAAATMALPLHHRDPFDRMLIAQAMVEGCTLVTSDRMLEVYGVPLLIASVA